MRSLVFLLLGAVALDYHAPATLDENDDVREEDEESLSEVTAEAEIASLQAKIRDQVAAIAATHAEIERVKAQLEEKDSDDSEQVSTATTSCSCPQPRSSECGAFVSNGDIIPGCTSEKQRDKGVDEGHGPQEPEPGKTPYSMDGIPGKRCGVSLLDASTGSDDWKAHENASTEDWTTITVYRITAAPKYTSNINVATLDGMCGVRDTLTWLFTEAGGDQYMMKAKIEYRGSPTEYGLCNGGVCENSNDQPVDRASFGRQDACGDYGGSWYSLVAPEGRKWRYKQFWKKARLSRFDWMSDCASVKREIQDHF